ncbi:MAG: biopolymer transporter ExbD [Verrucomicrobiota bacterium]
MKFVRKKRKPPTVPIITLIDILAILLIFFIYTMQFKQQETLLKVNIPQSSQLSGETAEIRRIPIALGKNGEVSVGQDLLQMNQLAAKLVALKTTDPSVELELKADSQTTLDSLVQLWSAASQAGVTIKDLPLKISTSR